MIILTPRNEIRTTALRIKIAEVIFINGIPCALIKHSRKIDIITLNEFASQLYGKEVICEIKLK